MYNLFSTNIKTAMLNKYITYFFIDISFIFLMCYNGLALGEEADFEVQNSLPALYLIRSTKLHISTESAFLPNAC